MSDTRYSPDPNLAPVPWYRQFWPWFLIAFPLASVIAGITTLVIASLDPDGLVVSDYYREGLAINEDRARQQSAEKRGLRGLLQFDPDTGVIAMRLYDREGARTPSESLTLRFVHPTRAHMDAQTELLPALGQELTGTLRAPTRGLWHIVVEPTDGRWRLRGQMTIPDDANVELLPG